MACEHAVGVKTEQVSSTAADIHMRNIGMPCCFISLVQLHLFNTPLIFDWLTASVWSIPADVV